MRKVHKQPFTRTFYKFETMVKFSGMSLLLTALAATRHCSAFNVGSFRTAARPFTTRLSASDNDFDGFSSKVSQ